MLPGGALSVVTAADDNAVPGCLGTLRKGGIADLEAEFAEVGDVGAVGQDFRTGRHDMVGGDVVANLQHQLGGEGIGKGLALGEFLDVGAAKNFGGLCLLRGQGHQDGGVIDLELLGHGYGYALAQGSGVSDVACEGGGHGSLRGDKVDLTVPGAAAAKEVAVEGTQADAAGIG